MRKIIKNPIFTFIIGAIIFGSVGVVASQIFASDIGYTPSDSTWKKSNGEDITNVKEAIDELYSKVGDNSIINTFGQAVYETSQGTPMTTRNMNPKSLSKGKYIIAYSAGEAWGDSGSYSSSNGISTINRIDCASSNCVINYLGGYNNTQKAQYSIGSSFKVMMTATTVLFYVEIKEETDTISAYTTAAATYDTGAQFVTIQIIPID